MDQIELTRQLLADLTQAAAIYKKRMYGDLEETNWTGWLKIGRAGTLDDSWNGCHLTPWRKLVRWLYLRNRKQLLCCLVNSVSCYSCRRKTGWCVDCAPPSNRLRRMPELPEVGNGLADMCERCSKNLAKANRELIFNKASSPIWGRIFDKLDS